MDSGTVFFDVEPVVGGGRKGTMIQVALKLTKITIAALKTLAGSIKTGLTGNASFPTPSPTPAQIDTAITAVSDQEVIVGAAAAALVAQEDILEQKVDALRNVLRAVVANCQDTVKNDPEEVAREKLLSANLTLKADAEPAPEVERPENFHISQGDHSGEVDGGCDRVSHSKMYRVRCGATPESLPTTVYEGTKSSFTAKNVPIGLCYMQMSAFGTNGGWSEWSDIASIRVV